MKLTDKVEKYDLTVLEILSKIYSEFVSGSLGLFLYEIEQVLECDHVVARKLYEEFIKEES